MIDTVLSSGQNRIFKHLKKLKQSAYRKRSGSFLLEGIKLVDEALSQGADAMSVYVMESKADELSNRYKEIAGAILSDELFRQLSDQVSPEGVLAEVAIPEFTHKVGDRVLLLDQLNDPGNFGTLIRSAEAFGFRDVLYTKGTVDPYNAKVVRSAMGSILRVNLVACDVEEIPQILGGYRMISTAMVGQNVFDLKTIEKPYCLMIGSESHGLSSMLMDLADLKVTIPMEGRVESLNAGVAGSLLMGLFRNF